eukprot:15019303-Ditylum_brightwellii.AAC.1
MGERDVRNKKQEAQSSNYHQLCLCSDASDGAAFGVMILASQQNGQFVGLYIVILSFQEGGI